VGTMASTTVLLISSDGAKTQMLVAALAKRYRVVIAFSGKEGLALAKLQAPRIVILDAVSMRVTGERICRLLKHELSQTLLIHIHPGPRKEAKSQADTLLIAPVTARRLVNSVGRLLHQEEQVIGCGPFSLNVPRRILIAHGHETHLTPKQAALVALFLRHPGQTMDRKTIMETVWQTDYVGDTRTLDVHIRWIRKMLEKDSQKPRYLKTVRGVGYQLIISNPENLRD